MKGGSNFAGLDCAPVDQQLEDFRGRASAPFPKFVMRLSTLLHELRKQRGTSSSMSPVPLSIWSSSPSCCMCC